MGVLPPIIVEASSGISQILTDVSLSELDAFIPDKETVIITDENVFQLYSERFPDIPTIIIPSGEASKSLQNVENIYKRLIDSGISRDGFIVGIGGGVVCDIAGFTASTYKRGIRFGFVASTLIAQADAAIGGKNGVNLSSEGILLKNMVGTIRQPEFIICDTEMLKTLPEKELICGFGEVAKTALLSGESDLRFLEDNSQKLLSAETPSLRRAVRNAAAFKAHVVNKDEYDDGYRHILNFGHTVGHALESLTAMAHGEAVAVGMTVSLEFSEKLGLLGIDSKGRILNLLRGFHLPVTLPDIDIEKIANAISFDKKRKGNILRYILLQGTGMPLIRETDFEEIRELLNDLHQH